MPRRTRGQNRTAVRKNAIFDLAVKLTEMGYLLKIYWRNMNADIVASKGRKITSSKYSRLQIEDS